MANELNIKIAGEAGQGMQTIGASLCRIFQKAGFNIFANQDYMSRIRGGNNFFQLRIADRPVYAHRRKADITVALDKASVSLCRDETAAGGVMILDKKKFNIPGNDNTFFDVPMYAMAAETGGSEIYTNSAACGILAGIAGIEFDYAEKVLRNTFSDKSEEVIKKNIDTAKAGYDFARNNFKSDKFKVKKGVIPKPLLINGNEAIALGAIRAGCKFYSAYPMSPSTSIMNTIAHYAGQFNIVVEQAEDEIAAINMAIGASFAGARSMTATSGGGFALMVEGVSLSAMTETPVVIAVAQRPAPATGFPTRTEQADLNFVLHAGHGEFARAIYTPGTIEEAFYLTVKAFNTADKYQIPVFIMTDQHLADCNRGIDFFDLAKAEVERHLISKEESKNITGYKRYQFTGSGISPRAIPSWIEDVIYADSDEHTEEGHITEDAGIRIKMVEKRFYKKMDGLSKEIEAPVAYNTESADVILMGFGSTYGAIKEASAAITNKKVGFIHLPQVWPFPAARIMQALKGAKEVLTVENNAGGQLAKLLRREAGLEPSKTILKFDGRPFDLDYLVDRIKEGTK